MKIPFALVLALFLAACTSSVSPAIELRSTTPLPVETEDAGGSDVAVDAGPGATGDTDAGTPPSSEDAGSKATSEDSGTATPTGEDSGTETITHDAGPSVACQVAPTEDNTCGSYGFPHYLMLFCTDGDAGPAACPSGDSLVAYNSTGSDYMSQCCEP